MLFQPIDTQDDGVPVDFSDMESNILMMILNGQANFGKMGNGTRLARVSIRHIERYGMAEV